jgi:hypothetical protein
MNLIEACIRGDTDGIKEGIEDETDIRFLHHILQLACCYGRLILVNALLQDGRADPTLENNHALGLASEHGHIDIVNVLLQDGRVEPTIDNDIAIKKVKTQEIKDMLIAYKYRVDGKEYCRLKDLQ